MNPVKKFVEQESYSTYQIARMAGISQASVCRHINGLQGISKKSIRKYARRLNLNTAELHRWNEKLAEKREENP